MTIDNGQLTIDNVEAIQGWSANLRSSKGGSLIDGRHYGGIWAGV